MTKRSPTLRDITASPAAPETDIAGLTADSRQVQPGFLFAALAGTAANGADYIDDAIRRGAVAILSAPGVALTQPGITHLTDDNPRRAFAEMAARWMRGIGRANSRPAAHSPP